MIANFNILATRFTKFAILIVFFTLPARALENHYQTFKQRAVFTANNITEYLASEDVKFTQGFYAGQLIDQLKNRPVVMLSQIETLKYLYFTNFYNQGHFWIGELSKDSIVDVIFQLAHFKSGIGLTLSHAQLRFKLNKPLNLYRVKNGQIVSTQTSDLIFTIQAALPKGGKYSLIDALAGNYQIVARLLNTYDRVFLEELPEGDVVTQYKLKSLNKDQKYLLFYKSVHFSSAHLFEKSYYATDANCVNLLMDIIDHSLNFKKPRIELGIENMLLSGTSPVEKLTLDALFERNLIDESSRIENLNTH